MIRIDLVWALAFIWLGPFVAITASVAYHTRVEPVKAEATTGVKCMHRPECCYPAGQNWNHDWDCEKDEDR